MVSKYEKVKSNAGCTCSGDLTYCENDIRNYNEIQRGQTVKTGDTRCEKRKRRYVQGCEGRYERGVAIYTGTTESLFDRSHAVLKKKVH